MRVFISGPYGDTQPSYVKLANTTKAAAWAKDILAWGHLPFCLSPDTPILTRELVWKDIGSLKEGDKLLGFDEEGSPLRHLAESTVISSKRRYAPCYCITMEDGTEVICSKDHQWLAKKTLISGTHGGKLSWESSEALYKSLYSPIRKGPLTIYRVAPLVGRGSDFDSGYLSGAFDGEGCIYLGKMQKSLQFSQKTNSMLDTVLSMLVKKGYSASPVWGKTPKDFLIARVNVNGGVYSKLKFLMEFRPPRLLDVWQASKLEGVGLGHKNTNSYSYVKSIEEVGIKEVVSLTTSTKTYIAAGLASHNCPHSHSYGWEHDERFTTEDFLRLDKDIIAGWAEVVLRLPGDSPGADVEGEHAIQNGVLVLDLRMLDESVDVGEWVRDKLDTMEKTLQHLNR